MIRLPHSHQAELGSTDMPLPQVTDALKSCYHRHRTGGWVPFASFEVPNLLRLILDRNLQAPTCHTKQQTYHRPRSSLSECTSALRSKDRQCIPSGSAPPSCDRAGSHVSHEAVRSDCPICCSRFQPARLPTFEPSDAREHLPDFPYVINLSASSAPEMYMRGWPSLPKDTGVVSCPTSRTSSCTAWSPFAYATTHALLRGALIQRPYHRSSAQETRCGQGCAPTLHRPGSPAARSVVV